MVWDLIPTRGKRFFHLKNVTSGSGAHSASYAMGKRGSFCWDKAARVYEVHHSLLVSAYAKNEWNCKSALVLCLHGVDRGNNAFLVTFNYYCYHPRAFHSEDLT